MRRGRLDLSGIPPEHVHEDNFPMGTFHDRLAAVSERNNSLLCVGLDPEPSFHHETVLDFNKAIVESTIHLACAYKPNLAIYESMGCDGLGILEETLRFIRDLNPDMPVIGDAKRGDIGQCSLAYVRTMFDAFDFDAVTVSPYMGSDSLQPFLDHHDRGVFVLCRTSNPGGADLQELTVIDERDGAPKPLYEVVAGMAANDWNANGNVGLVVGATVPDQMRRIREAAPNLLFLIPGIGPQGGDLSLAVSSAVDARGGGFVISASRQIMYAAQTSTRTHRTTPEARKRIEKAAKEIRDGINRALKSVEEPNALLVSDEASRMPLSVR